MKSLLTLTLLVLAFSSYAFTAVPTRHGLAGGSSFVVSQHASVATAAPSYNRHKTSLYMASQAKFGIFSPAVYVAKIVLGNEKLNKIRGKAISLHSQKITEFCEWVGAYHLRTRLIKKAKTNGDTLGFLV